MPTKLKKATKRTSSRKVSKPTKYGTKATPPQRGKRAQSRVTKVSANGTKKAAAKPVASKAAAKPVASKARSKPAPKVQEVVELETSKVAAMPPIGSRSEDLVDTEPSEDEITVTGDGKSKYPWNNYSKVYLHGKWKCAMKTAQELRGEIKKLTGEVSEAKKDAVHWKREATAKVSLGSTSDEKVQKLKLEVIEEKGKHCKALNDVKARLLKAENEHSTAIGVKGMQITKMKMDHQIELNAEKLKVEKLLLLNKNLTEKVGEYKDEIVVLKDANKEFNKIKMLSIKNNVQLKNEYEKAGIR